MPPTCRTGEFAAALLVAGVTLGCGRSEREGHALAITHVTVVDVEKGQLLPEISLLMMDDTIAAVESSAHFVVPPNATVVDGRGRFLIPGLWDMHTHAHRRGRATWHYPLYVTHGVTGIRDMGTDLDSALYHRTAWRDTMLAPRVWWGSPPIDGASPTLSFGIPAKNPEDARELARSLQAQGFRFLKVYDRIDPATYTALSDEARRLGIPLEGHVPLRLSPSAAITAGQHTIEHLTLVLESCIPGTLAWIAADTTGDSMGLLSDGRLANTLDRFDRQTADELFARLAEAHVWQVPTLVQMRGAFFIGDSAFVNDPRLRLVPGTVRAEWEEYKQSMSPEKLEAGARVFRRQLTMTGEMHRAGVPMLAGTDASAEPWVFPGSSLHDELALFVEAGLSPIEALRTATLNPARYRGETRALIAPGSVADLVVLSGDPTHDIQQVRNIQGVILRGRYMDVTGEQ